MTTPAAPAQTPAAPAPAAATPAAPAPAPADDSSAAFDAAFGEATAATPAATPAPSPAPSPAPTPAPAPAATPAPTSAPAPAAGTEGAAAAPSPAAPAPAPAEPSVEDRLTAALAQIEELKKGAQAPAAQTPAAPAPAATPAPTPAPIYSADETAQIEAYRKEWGDVAAGEALVRRGEYQHLVAHIFGQIGPMLDELRAQVVPAATHTTYQRLVQLVPDYDEIRDPVLAWVDKQPAALKAAYEDITSTGTPQDVAALIETFRTSTGWKGKAAAPAPAAAAPAGAPAAPAPAPAATPAPAPALSPAAAAAAASLAPVSTGRGAPAGGPDPNDFAGAFKEFAAEQK